MKNPSYSFNEANKKKWFKLDCETIIMRLLLFASILLIGYLLLLIYLALAK